MHVCFCVDLFPSFLQLATRPNRSLRAAVNGTKTNRLPSYLASRRKQQLPTPFARIRTADRKIAARACRPAQESSRAIKLSTSFVSALCSFSSSSVTDGTTSSKSIACGGGGLRRRLGLRRWLVAACRMRKGGSRRRLRRRRRQLDLMVNDYVSATP